MVVPGEGKIDVGDGIGIDLTVVTLDDRIHTLLACEVGVGAGIALLGNVHIGVIDLDAARHVEPIGYVVLEVGTEHITTLFSLVDHLIHDPVGVLERHVARTVIPCLRIEVARFVPTLVETHVVKVVAARKEIERRQRVEVFARCDHVLVVLQDVARTQIDGQLVFEELGDVAEREVVAVVAAVGQDVAGIGRRGRKIGLVLLRTRREGQGVVDVRPRVEESFGIKAAQGFVAPALVGPGNIAVGILEAGHHERRREGGVVGEGHRRFVGLSLLGVDEHHAVGSVRTVESRG